ncbi:MAG TPA: SDR family oxidoreductase [Candidatus Nanoarchaeia archaeon]|nr:SDR family oxidoreductase [Candidatus Nanoarchaeia archaeon]
MDHKQRVAIVCASSKGLGKACAEALLRDNARVAICSHDRKNLEKARNELEKKYKRKVLAVNCDLTKKEDIKAMVEKVIDTFGTVHILYNNTPGPKPGNFFDFKDEDWKKAHDMLLMPVIRLHRLVLPIMRKQNFGRIINSTSLVVKEPVDNLLLSEVYRLGIISIAKILSKEYAKDNVFINNVCPAAFRTERYEQLMKLKVTAKKSLRDVEGEIVKGIPIGRLQNPMELGNLVSFLASDQCFITGTTIAVDGGASRGLF